MCPISLLCHHLLLCLPCCNKVSPTLSPTHGSPLSVCLRDPFKTCVKLSRGPLVLGDLAFLSRPPVTQGLAEPPLVPLLAIQLHTGCLFLPQGYPTSPCPGAQCCFFLLSYTCMCWIFQASLLTIGGLIYLIGFKNIYVLFASMFLSPALTLLPILVLYVQLLTGHLQVICLLNTFTLTHSQWNT